MPYSNIITVVKSSNNIYAGTLHSVINNVVTLRNPRTIIEPHPGQKYLPVDVSNMSMYSIYDDIKQLNSWKFGNEIGVRVMFTAVDYAIEINPDEIINLKKRIIDEGSV